MGRSFWSLFGGKDTMLFLKILRILNGIFVISVALSATARILILGDWINYFSYAVFDGENLFLENYIEGETQL